MSAGIIHIFATGDCGMRHLGDICKINGAEIEPVDIITGGSPCQDLSIAGNREGLAGERSGLFLEMIRVITEMREAEKERGRTDELIRPRYVVWENVPGAFSSNKGRDFRAVLTAFVRIADPEAPEVPFSDKAGGWPHAGSYCGVGADGQPFSVAYRLHNAQYWGVPQRRKRICVLADFAGFTAPWILFDPQFERTSQNGEPVKAERDTGGDPRPEVPPVSESLSRHTEPGGTAGEGTPAGTESGFGSAGWDQGTFYPD